MIEICSETLGIVAYVTNTFLCTLDGDDCMRFRRLVETMSPPTVGVMVVNPSIVLNEQRSNISSSNNVDVVKISPMANDEG